MLGGRQAIAVFCGQVGQNSGEHAGLFRVIHYAVALVHNNGAEQVGEAVHFHAVQCLHRGHSEMCTRAAFITA